MTDTKTVKTRKKREPAPIPKSIIEMLVEIEAVLPEFTKAIFTICISERNSQGGRFSTRSAFLDFRYTIDKENEVLIISKCRGSASVHFNLNIVLDDCGYDLVANVHAYYVASGNKF